MRNSSPFRPNQSFPPSRAPRRFGLRFAFSNARPPLPPPRRGIVRNSSTSWLNHRCLGGAGALVRPLSSLRLIRGKSSAAGGALGFASPDPTKGWDLPPRARGPSCETRPRLGKNLSLARARGADSSAFLRFAYFADYPAGQARRGRLTQHPSGRLRRCPSGSAYSQNRARQFPD